MDNYLSYEDFINDPASKEFRDKVECDAEAYLSYRETFFYEGYNILNETDKS